MAEGWGAVVVALGVPVNNDSCITCLGTRASFQPPVTTHKKTGVFLLWRVVDVVLGA